MEEIEGKLKNSTIYEGYTYHVDKRLEGTYRCSTRRNTGCQGLALINDDGKVIVFTPHDHPPNDMVLRTLYLKREMLRLCQGSVQPIKKIFDDVCESDPEAAMHISYPSFKSTLNRKRAACKPPVPDSFASLSVELEKYDSCKDIYKGSVIAEDGSMGLLFSSDELLNALNETTELYVDGTFSVVPRKPNIVQLYTIHIRYMNTGIATVFILCESRTKNLYRAIWKKVIKLAPALQNNVKFIMLDYERAAISILHEFFPAAAIHGCWFHFNQAILRKWRQLGLTNAPKTLILMAMAIPLIPHIRFQEAFTILQRIADNICDNHPAVLRFMSYMRNIWLDISTKVSVYNCPVRTNNFVESFHNTASKHFGRHTSIWIFIDNLKKLIITQQIDFGRAKNNLQVRRSNLKISKKRNDFILQKQEDLRQNRIALTEFLKSFHQFTETQQYLIDATSSSVMPHIARNVAAILQQYYFSIAILP
ncbi:uncharacterized protein [Linepithema humile]|uniref:uncharacterized protein n=1 Tax=Linepithema humile TaxID=83485 RepID=UPI00351F7265